jgi:hypothetical protein
VKGVQAGVRAQEGEHGRLDGKRQGEVSKRPIGLTT